MDIGKVFTFTDEQIEGKWFPWDDQGCELKIARAGNPEHQQWLDRAFKPYRKMQGGIPKGVRERINREGMARFVLKGWKKVSDGLVELEYTIENAIKLFEKYPDFQLAVFIQGNDYENFFEDEADPKNSVSSPDGHF